MTTVAEQQQEKLTSDPKLLETMLKDMEAAPSLYQPTAYWKSLESKNLEWLKGLDLNHFRNAYKGGNTSFNASMYGVMPEICNSYRDPSFFFQLWSRVFGKLSSWFRFFDYFNPGISRYLFRKLTRSQKQLENLSLYAAKLIDDESLLSQIEDSGLGNPTDLIFDKGKKYTLNFLKSFSQYTYAKKLIPFGEVKSILEIGSGYGAQAEFFLKAFPDLKYCIVDIPPQLYVAERYLSACFPGEVLSYSETRDEAVISPEMMEGKRILVLAPWQLPKLEGFQFDLFWNSASFQEMEPSIVENYAKYIQENVSSWIYLRNLKEGSVIVPGRGKNVQQRITLQDYIRFFDQFNLIEEEPAEVIPNIQLKENYIFMIFKRNQ